MSNVQLTKSSPESDLKRYFTAVLELSKSDNQFPINLDEVWMLVYSEKGKAVRALKKNFFENEDFILLAQNGKQTQGGHNEVSYFLSLSCLEYFIARKVRPVFEVYRKVFHKTAVSSLPMTYKDALAQLLSQVEQNERLQEENDRIKERSDKHFTGLVVAQSLIKDQKKIIREQEEEIQTKQNIINLQSGELDELIPKGRIYDSVIQTPQDSDLSTTTSVANEIGMSGQKLNKMLVASGIIYKAQNGDYLFTSDYLRWGLGKTISTIVDHEKGRVKTYIKWNTRGRAYIHALHYTNWDKRRAWRVIKKGNEIQ